MSAVACAVLAAALLACAAWRIASLTRECARLRRLLGPASMLGRECAVEDALRRRSYVARVVAVTANGTIKVRGRTLRTRDGEWVDHRDVPDRVRWL